MRLWLAEHCALKMLDESPSVYDIKADELYELDAEALEFIQTCASIDGAKATTSEFVSYCIDEGILTEAPVTTHRPPLNESPTPSLRYLELQITRRCNLRCSHCYLGPPKDDELSPASVERILKELQQMQGLRVLLTGGEPLMHREFAAINDLLPSFALRTILFTNGTLLTDKMLKNLNAHEILISIDGRQKAHDTLRGEGSYKQTMDAIERAMQHDFEVSVSTMVHPDNLGDFDYMQEQFNKMGIRDWSVDIPCEEGNLQLNPAHKLSPKQAGKYLEYGFGNAMHGGAEGYGCGRHLMSVMAEGNCAKCAFYAERPTGTIADGLAECWSRVKHFRLSELKCDCKHIDECRGGCRYRAELLGGETEKDLYRCSLYDII